MSKNAYIKNVVKNISAINNESKKTELFENNNKGSSNPDIEISLYNSLENDIKIDVKFISDIENESNNYRIFVTSVRRSTSDNQNNSVSWKDKGDGYDGCDGKRRYENSDISHYCKDKKKYSVDENNIITDDNINLSTQIEKQSLQSLQSLESESKSSKKQFHKCNFCKNEFSSEQELVKHNAKRHV